MGLSDANSYVDKLGKSKTSETFFIPEGKIKSDDFVKYMDMYMSKDRNITKIDIMLNVDPYSEQAMDVVKNINNKVSAKINASTLMNIE